MARCQGKTKSGTQCKLPVQAGTDFCRHHSPAAAPTPTTVEAKPSWIRTLDDRIIFDWRYRLVVLIFVFAAAWILFRPGGWLSESFQTSTDFLLSFLSTVVQAVAALAALLLAFLIFTMQDVNQRRHNEFYRFRTRIDDFMSLAVNRPFGLTVFDAEIDRIVYSYSLVRLEDLSINAKSPMTGWSWHEVVSPFLSRFDEIASDLDRGSQRYLQRMVAALYDAEESVGNIQIMWIEAVVIRRFVADSRELLVLLAVSLVGLLGFGADELHQYLFDLVTPASVFITAWLGLVFVNLAVNVRQIYVDFGYPWQL